MKNPEETMAELATEPDCFSPADKGILNVSKHAQQVLKELQLRTGESMETLQTALHKAWTQSQTTQESAGTKKKEPKPKPTIKLTGLQIDNHLANVEAFHKIQPFFYDKSLIFWFWNNTESKWEMTDDTDIMNALEKHLSLNGQTINSKLKNEYLEAFKRIGRTKTPQPAKKQWIQFRNKAYCLKCGKTYDVTPKYFFTNPLPYKMGKTSDTPNIDKLFTEWVGEEKKKSLYELIAYCCLTDYPIHLIFCLVGGGRNGKTSFQKILTHFIGKENTCSTELDTLLDSRFESFKLYRKLVCSMGETNFGIMQKTSLLKKLTGQDLIGYEIKNKGLFDDTNYAKIIINSNSLPTSQDTSEGFYRRWMIIDFPNEFPEGKDVTENIPEDEYENLSRKVTEILPLLLKEGRMSGQGSIEERRTKYIMASNPLPFFLQECCEWSEEAYVSYNELYTAYVHFLQKNKKRKVSQKEFRASLEDEGLFAEKTSKVVGVTPDGGSEYKIVLWVDGVRLKNDWLNFANFAIIPVFHTSSHIYAKKWEKNGKSQNKQNVLARCLKCDEVFCVCNKVKEEDLGGVL